jgi:hypothetical protein
MPSCSGVIEAPNLAVAGGGAVTRQHQGRDQTDAGDAVEAGEPELRETFVQIADRHPVDFAVAAVDLADQGGEFGLELAVGLDVAA